MTEQLRWGPHCWWGRPVQTIQSSVDTHLAGTSNAFELEASQTPHLYGNLCLWERLSRCKRLIPHQAGSPFPAYNQSQSAEAYDNAQTTFWSKAQVMRGVWWKPSKAN